MSAYVDPTGPIETKKCFLAENIWHRNGMLDWKMPAISAGSPGGFPIPYKIESKTTIYKAASKVMLGEIHLFSLPQIEQVMRNKELYGFDTDAKGNYFLVERSPGEICVIDINLFRDGRWAVYVREIKDPAHPGCRIFDKMAG